MTFRRLNARGFTHHIALMGFMVLFGVGGVGYLVATHAATAYGWRKLTPSAQKVTGATQSMDLFACRFATSNSDWEVKTVALLSGPITPNTLGVSMYAHINSPDGPLGQSPQKAMFPSAAKPQATINFKVNQKTNNFVDYYMSSQAQVKQVVKDMRPGALPTCPGAPAITAPTNFVQTASTLNSVTLNWQGGSAGNETIKEFDILYYKAGKAYIHKVRASEHSTRITGLMPGTTYTFSLQLIANGAAPYGEKSDSVKTAATTTAKNANSNPSSALKVSGTRILKTNGSEFIPYGVSVVDDLDQRDWQSRTAASDAQIVAAARYWHVNSIRLQVSENIIEGNATPGYSYNLAAMQRLAQEVDEIEALGKVPIINDCTLFTGNQQAPTANTLNFWRDFTSYLVNRDKTGKYANVVFDIFNEPKTDGKVWQSGGKYKGKTYLGMQDVVDDIRNGAALSNNLIMVEGPKVATTLALLDKYPIKGGNLLFAYHHLNIKAPSTWASHAGQQLKQKVPVVDGEWAEYAVGVRSGECHETSPQNTPAYLQFMREHHIGLILWSLQPGVAVNALNASKIHLSNVITDDFPTTASSYSQPNSFGANFSCDPSALGQGVGSEVMSYFKKYAD